MFETFENRVIISGVLETITGLHIGSAYARGSEANTDSPVIKDADGKPMIPGSSFKGALRSAVERLAKGLGIESCCITIKEDSGCISTDKDLQKEFDKEREKLKDEGKYEKYVQDFLCDVCQLFGSPYISSRVFIKDLRCISGIVEYNIRDGVAIDRDSETAGEHLKYNFEVVPTGTKFQFEAVAENITSELLGLLFVGLKQFEGNGEDNSAGSVPLGGMKSRGLGWVNLIIDEIEVIDNDNEGKLIEEDSAKLISYLINNRGFVMKKGTDGNFEKFIEAMVNSLLV